MSDKCKVSQQLEDIGREVEILKTLLLQKCMYFPELLDSGVDIITSPVGTEQKEPLEITAKLLEQLFDCLEHLASAGVVHRDITRRHILQHNGNLLLIDYGFSVFAGSDVYYCG